MIIGFKKEIQQKEQTLKSSMANGRRSTKLDMSRNKAGLGQQVSSGSGDLAFNLVIPTLPDKLNDTLKTGQSFNQAGRRSRSKERAACSAKSREHASASQNQQACRRSKHTSSAGDVSRKPTNAANQSSHSRTHGSTRKSIKLNGAMNIQTMMSEALLDTGTERNDGREETQACKPEASLDSMQSFGLGLGIRLPAHLVKNRLKSAKTRNEPKEKKIDPPKKAPVLDLMQTFSNIQALHLVCTSPPHQPPKPVMSPFGKPFQSLSMRKISAAPVPGYILEKELAKPDGLKRADNRFLVSTKDMIGERREKKSGNQRKPVLLLNNESSVFNLVSSEATQRQAEKRCQETMQGSMKALE